jgi:transcriptional/translational regulatory protein YebC/TACO1
MLSYPDGSVDVLTAPADFSRIQNALQTVGLVPETAEVTQRAISEITLNLEEARQMVKMLDVLEDLEDTQSVYSNADIPDEILGKL